LGKAWAAMTANPGVKTRQCANCRFFKNTPADLERSMGGLRVLGSGHSSVVSDDGMCEKLDRYLSGRYVCNLHETEA